MKPNPLIDKATITKNFSRAAATYDSHAQMQKFAAEQLAKLINDSATQSIGSIFEIGCGTGMLTEQLIAHFPDAQYAASDISAEMVQTCRAKIGNEQLSFEVVDGEQVSLDSNVDLIGAGLSVQWMDLQKCLSAWWPQTNAIAFSTLAAGTLGQWDAAFDDRSQQRVLNFLTPEQIQSVCQSLAPARFEFQTTQWSQTFDSVTDFLKSMKRIGAHAPADSQHDPTSLRRALRCFENGFTANYEIAFCYLSKEPRSANKDRR